MFVEGFCAIDHIASKFSAVNKSNHPEPDVLNANFKAVRHHLSSVNLGSILSEGDVNMLRLKFPDILLDTCQNFN